MRLLACRWLGIYAPACFCDASDTYSGKALSFCLRLGSPGKVPYFPVRSLCSKYPLYRNCWRDFLVLLQTKCFILFIPPKNLAWEMPEYP